MAERLVRNRYEVAVPGDAADTEEALGQLAITEARKRARLYCMPAKWAARRVSGAVGDWEVVFRVTRWHR